jgi:kumamolisin
VQLKELEVRAREAENRLAALGQPWWRKPEPLLLAILAGVLTLVGNMAIALYNSKTTREQDQAKAADALALEKQKARYSLVLQAIGTGDQKLAERNIRFFINAGLLDDADGRVAKALEVFPPVLPAPSGSSPRPEPLELPEIAQLYNFPLEYDGSGQTIGLLEFEDAYDRHHLQAFFSQAHLRMPDIVDVSIEGVRNRPERGMGQAEADIEVIGTIAPRALQRIYFAPLKGGRPFSAAIARAVSDGVSVILINWGQAEEKWAETDRKLIDSALKDAANRKVTVIVSAGDRSAEVSFPASSPWVLAVGGTSLVARDHQVLRETQWGMEERPIGSGGGVSRLFERPAWQKAPIPLTSAVGTGRAIPDVVAVADPQSGARLRIGGGQAIVGGTSLAAAVWAGLVVVINQGLGHNIGYVTPVLYERIGPGGVTRPVQSRKEQANASTSEPAWSAEAGWGSPDGRKLLDWLRAHP